ncbi:PQQ-like beta-propeller repeat protein [Streptosporangium sp. KLBMP 9127]|nr:PQQ-like beta-propeller repeat protein [Streptosporangium sp. KLBMP 9127]
MLTRRRLLAVSATASVAALAGPILRPGTAAASAAAPVVDALGSPLKDVLLIGGTVARGPYGKPVLWSASSGEPARLNSVDPATGKTLTSQPLEGTPGAYAVVSTRNGTIYVGAYTSGRLYRRRPGPDSPIEDLGRPLPSESYIYRLAVDEDDRLYGGTYPGGRVFRYDPRTGQTRDYGQLLPGLEYVRSTTLWGSHIYAGTQPDAHIFEIDKRTGKMRELPLPEGIGDGIGITAHDLNVYDGRLYARFGVAIEGRLGVYDIEAGKWTDLIDGVAGLDVSPPGRRGEVYFTQKNRLTAYHPRTRRLTPVEPYIPGRVANNRGIGWADLDRQGWPGLSVVGLLWRGALFQYNPITGQSATIQTDVPGEPIQVASLHAGANGTVYAGGYLSGYAEVDPGTGEATYQRFAQIESIRDIDGAIWIGGYPDSRLYRYDPSLPWSSPEYAPGPPGTADNPVKLIDLKAQHQARARAMTDAGTHMAYGTMPDVTTLGGALVTVDKATLQATVHLPVVTDQSVVSLTYAGGLIIGGTSIHGGYTVPSPTQTEARLFGWAVSSGKAFEVTPVPGAETIPGLVVDSAGLVWGLADGQLFAFDVATRQVVHRVQLAPDTGSTAGELARDRSGRIYALVQNHLVFSCDPATRTSQLVVDQKAQHLAVHPDGRIFISDDHVLYRVTAG